MVQEFCVLKCHSCELFQVHIVKKGKTWNCKVCGKKQSVVKVFGQGSAKDCRIHVQKLNEQHAHSSDNYVELSPSTLQSGNAVSDHEDHSLKDVNGSPKLEFLRRKLPNNKWQKYLESDKTSDSSDSDNTQKLPASYSSSNFVPLDELIEPVSKKICSSTNDSGVKKKFNESTNVENMNSNSQKIFKFSSDCDELNVIDDILDI